MDCVICHGKEIEKAEIREEIKTGNDIVYVSINIPVCKNCGERYYDRLTIQTLEGIREKLGNKELELKEVGKVLELAS
ncbi:MAG: YgiT-type zinc finger protein [Spirochaetota bacterium]|nr:YgiT-type zinc finger protein [Spirochaetota bacterium]